MSVVLKEALDDILKLGEIVKSAEDLRAEAENNGKELAPVLNKSKDLLETLKRSITTIESKLEQIAGTKTEPDDLDVTQDLFEQPPENRPLIKVVDINKLLVKPSIKSSLSPAKEKKKSPRKSVQFDSSVIIIDSSEEEGANRRSSKRNSVKKTQAKMTSDLSDNEMEMDSATKTKAPSPKRNSRRTISKLLKKYQISDTSDSSSESEIESDDSDDYVKPSPKSKKPVKIASKKIVPQLDLNDKKLKSGCVVKVLRVNCEEMKEFYEKIQDDKEIERLTDLSSLKRGPSKSTATNRDDEKDPKEQEKDGDEGNNEENIGKATENLEKSIPHRDDHSSDKSDNGKLDGDDGKNEENLEKAPENLEKSIPDGDDHSSDKSDNEKLDGDEEKNGEKLKKAPENPKKSNPDRDDHSTDKSDSERLDESNDLSIVLTPPVAPPEDKETMAALALDLLKSDEEKENSDKEDSESEKEDSNKSKKRTRADKSDSSSDNDKQLEKKRKEPKVEGKKEDNTKDVSSEPANENETVDDPPSNEIDVEKSKNDKWKRDKLLTQVLSSDSDENLSKYNTKKAKLEEKNKSASSEDDSPKIAKKKKFRQRKLQKKVTVIDSDSEDGATAKKDSDDDFQVSKNDKSSDSSSSDSSSLHEEATKKEENKKKVLKRVRVCSSSDDSDDKSTRKTIRKVMGRESLAQSTLRAEEEEKERKARLAEKQKKYNNVFDLGLEAKKKVDKVVLDFDEKTSKELLKVDEKIVEKLKPHQAAGVRFMWEACFESLERTKKTKGSGCILAHCMGLGKTLQVIALIHTLLTNEEKTSIKRVMVVCPLSTVLNWVNEFRLWLPDEDDVDIYELVSFKQNYERQHQLKQWHQHGGVLIIGYDMFRNLSNPKSSRLSKKMRSVFQETLLDPGPDLVVCDEGHLLKNEKTNLSIAMNRLKTMRRIVLTGTPLQNNLKEYFCMVQFIKPSLLGTYKEYLNRFVNPITNGQYTDSTPKDILVMRKRSHVLHRMLDGVVQRRDYSVLAPYLPPKHEYVLFLNLSETQIKLYDYYMRHFAKQSHDGKTSFLFVDFQAFQRICTHPRVLLDKSMEMKNKEFLEDENDSEGSLKDFIDDDDDSASKSSSSKSDSDSDDDLSCKSPAKPVKKRLTRGAVAKAIENGDNVEDVIDLEGAKEWWQEICDGPELDNITHSSKLTLLFEILKECEQIGDKVLLFSQSLYSLNVIEYFLKKVQESTDEQESLNGYTGSWLPGLDYFRLDGSTSCDDRSACCKHFNNPKNTRARLFLISTRAGGLGINLIGANRVIIFDVSWNPSHDIQSIYRVYRFGQQKPCYIYRFVTYGTMEMKIYERQVTKQAISKRVIDEQQIDRHYNSSDLQELYKFDPNPESRPIPLVPKDVLLGEMLQKFDKRIYKYHEHQSLLENKEEECLNEEERKLAWEEFENEKKARNVYGNANMMMSDLAGIGALYGFPPPPDVNSPMTLLTAMKNILHRQNPVWTEAQLNQLSSNYLQQMQSEMEHGDRTIQNEVQREMQSMYDEYARKVRARVQQQQAMHLYQQQMKWAKSMAKRMPGNSGMPFADGAAGPSQSNSSEVIELND